MSFEQPTNGLENVLLKREDFEKMQTLTLKIENEKIGEILQKFNESKGLNLQSRPEGFHFTIISPTEGGIFKKITDEQIEKINTVLNSIISGGQLEIMGIGFINGTEKENAREADKAKKVLYLSINSEVIQALRKELGLPEKDLHVTLGFEGGDIHSEVIGKNDKGKDIIKPISKKADLSLNNLFNLEDFINTKISL